MPDHFCNRCGERDPGRLSRFRIVESRDGQPDEVIYWTTLCRACLNRLDPEDEREEETADRRRRNWLVGLGMLTAVLYGIVITTWLR